MLGLVALIGILIGLLGLGAIYQALATHRDRQRFLPPGKFIEINGKNWHYQMMGEGYPTVSRPKTFAIALPWNNNCCF
jgi:hypothetical protein